MNSMFLSCAEAQQQIFLLRHRSMPRFVMLLTALIHMQEFRSILPMLMRLPSQATIQHLFHADGIPVCSRLTDCMPTLSFPMVRTIPSGVREYLRDIRMQSEELKAFRTESSIQFL